MENLNELSYAIIGAAFTVHRELGPGLLESTYEVCLLFELQNLGFYLESQKILPVNYKNIQLDAGYRIDILVENQIILELKSVDAIAPIHKAQILTYLKLSNIKLGLLLNFNVKDMKQGINRFVM
jgi:GxxExxY protein